MKIELYLQLSKVTFNFDIPNSVTNYALIQIFQSFFYNFSHYFP